MTLEPMTPPRRLPGPPTTRLLVDRRRRAVSVDGRPAGLRRRELELLAFLVARAGRYVPRAEILEAVWHDRYGTCTNTLHVHLSRLRSKLGERPDRPVFLPSCRDRGVMFAGQRAHTFSGTMDLYVARPPDVLTLAA